MFISFCTGHNKIVELLIQNGADVDAVGENCNTPITMAAKRGKKSVFFDDMWSIYLLIDL